MLNTVTGTWTISLYNIQCIRSVLSGWILTPVCFGHLFLVLYANFTTSVLVTKPLRQNHRKETLRNYDRMSHCMGKPTVCIGENKDVDQLRSICEADQRLCFRYSDSTTPLLSNPKFHLAVFCYCTGQFVSGLVGTQIVGLLRHRLIYSLISGSI